MVVGTESVDDRFTQKLQRIAVGYLNMAFRSLKNYTHVQIFDHTTKSFFAFLNRTLRRHLLRYIPRCRNDYFGTEVRRPGQSYLFEKYFARLLKAPPYKLLRFSFKCLHSLDLQPVKIIFAGSRKKLRRFSNQLVFRITVHVTRFAIHIKERSIGILNINCFTDAIE